MTDTRSLLADSRRHDLDALRALAMLLGILLHGAMSFIPGAGVLWGVQDSQSSPFYGVLLSSIHGWRMPLFFLISGFFTAMLWNKRGTRELLIHRFKRIFLPLILSMVTIIPAMLIVSGYLQSQGSAVSSSAHRSVSADGLPGKEPTSTSSMDVWASVALGDRTLLKKYHDQGGTFRITDPYGSTPLHIACLFGRSEAAAFLLEAGAECEAKNNEGKLPEELLQLDWGATAFIAQLVRVPVDRQTLLAGREKIARSISEKTGRFVTATADIREDSAKQNILVDLLFHMPVFYHLWFLWFLCWYVSGFALIVWGVQTLRIPSISTQWLTSGFRYLWLIPLTTAAQYFMASSQHAFGPDTSISLLPMPAVFAYYAIFFGYGAMYFGTADHDVTVGRAYWWTLPLAMLVLFPIGLSLQGPQSIGRKLLFAAIQVSYAWIVSFGMMGLFHRFFKSQSPWVRYLSDSSYWLYLVHIPILMICQFLVRDWQIPSFLKFVLVCTVTTSLLIISYQWLVRNTWIGVLLNGRRYPSNQNKLVNETSRCVDHQTEERSVVNQMELSPVILKENR